MYIYLISPLLMHVFNILKLFSFCFRDALIFVKIFENKELLDASYFQKNTKTTALFEFIGRDDIFLESKLISLSFENANRKLDQVFKHSSIVNLNIVEYDLPDIAETEQNTERSTPEHPNSDNAIIISDSPDKVCSDVIEITSSPPHSSPDKHRRISGSSSEDQDTLPVLATKRRRIFTDLSDFSTGDANESRKRKRLSSEMSDSSESNTEIKGEIIWDIDGNCTFRVSYSNVEGQRMKSTKDGRNWTRYNNSFTKNFQKEQD